MFETLESRRMFDASLGQQQTIDSESTSNVNGARETTIVMDHTIANAQTATTFSNGKLAEGQNTVS